MAGSADFKDIPNSKRILQRCGFVERLKIIYILRRFCMSNSVIFSPGTFFHGTKADLSVGDLLVPGIYLIMMKTGLPTMFILQGPWTLPSGVVSYTHLTLPKKRIG